MTFNNVMIMSSFEIEEELRGDNIDTSRRDGDTGGEVELSSCHGHTHKEKINQVINHPLCN